MCPVWCHIPGRVGERCASSDCRPREERWLREAGRLAYSIMVYCTLKGMLGCVDAGLGCTPRAVVERSAFNSDVLISPIAAHIARIETLLMRCRDGAMQKLSELMKAHR